VTIIGMMVFQPESAVSDMRESCEKNWNDSIPARIGLAEKVIGCNIGWAIGVSCSMKG
jgi:hypothetical protein